MTKRLTDEERKQDAADIAVDKLIENLVRRHKPEDFMLSLGVRFAMGFSYISPEERESVMSEFLWRLRKYTGLSLDDIINKQEEPVS